MRGAAIRAKGPATALLLLIARESDRRGWHVGSKKQARVKSSPRVLAYHLEEIVSAEDRAGFSGIAADEVEHGKAGRRLSYVHNTAPGLALIVWLVVLGGERRRMAGTPSTRAVSIFNLRSGLKANFLSALR
jgi:hypothetical protein